MDTALIGEFLTMGKHGAFIWGAYGVTSLILLALLAGSWRRLKSAEALKQALDSARRRDGAPAAGLHTEMDGSAGP